MKLLIAIATYKRIEKLARCLNSLVHSSYKNFDILVVADNNDIETVNYINEIKAYPFGGDKINIVMQESQKFVIGAWNRAVMEKFIPGNYDGFIGLVDDVELRSDALEKAVAFHQDRYIDGDGVIGFNQVCDGYPNYNFKWFGQTLMGRKFIERYKEGHYQIACTDFFHFYQDEEMYNYAISLDKFYPCKQAILNHDHPSFTGNFDETHDLIRKGNTSPLKHDTRIYALRRAKGFLWGKDFNLIGDIEC